MLESFSWYQYLTTVALVTATYYIVAGALLFRHEIGAHLRGSQRATPTPRPTPANLMGPARRSGPQHTMPQENTVDSESLTVAHPHEPEEPVTDARVTEHEQRCRQQAERLTEEIHTLAAVVARGTKQEGAELFRTLLANYALLRHTPYEQQLNATICNACNAHNDTFRLTPAEVQTWWPPQEGQSQP